jgi:hypothetical protein
MALLASKKCFLTSQGYQGLVWIVELWNKLKIFGPLKVIHAYRIWGMGFSWYHIAYWNIFHVSDFYLINKTFTFKLFLFGNKFGFAGNIWTCLSANITIHNVVTGIINEPQKLWLPWQVTWLCWRVKNVSLLARAIRVWYEL